MKEIKINKYVFESFFKNLFKEIKLNYFSIFFSINLFFLFNKKIKKMWWKKLWCPALTVGLFWADIYSSGPINKLEVE